MSSPDMQDSELRPAHSRKAIAACTIISKNYLAYARVLTRSFLEHHPDARVFVLLVDRLEGAFRPEDEQFELIEIEELDCIPELRSFLFQYSQLESNTAAKPFLLEYLLDTYDLDELIYLDPDILVLRDFETLRPLIDENSIVLTPHMMQPIDDGCSPSEIQILRAGTYNLGFIAIRDTETTRRFLGWWQDRLRDRCISLPRKGYFVDQRWIDLVPGYFDDVHILKDPGYNVAYWNLHERKITGSGDKSYEVNGQPLCFFHFSGIEIDRLETVSKHQDRFKLADLGDGASLFRTYKDRVIEAGHASSKGWRYTFDFYEDGKPISSYSRNLYRELGPVRRKFGDPFRTSGLRKLIYPAAAAFHSKPSRKLRDAFRSLFKRRPAE